MDSKNMLPCALEHEAAAEIEHLALELQTERATVAGLRKSAALRVQFHAAELADMTAERDHAVEQAAKNADEVVRLREQVTEQALQYLAASTQLADAYQDAERYRWLRNFGPICVGNAGPVGLAMFTKTESDCVALDAAIDAASKAAP